MPNCPHVEVTPLEVAEGLFEALKDVPELLANAKMTPAMLLHETAARTALLDWAEGRTPGFGHLPAEVRSLAAAFITQFLHLLATHDPAFAGATWRVPAGESLARKAMHAVAQELRQQEGPAQQPH